MKKSVLREYARLIARTGVNVQPGQEVFIAAELDQPEFVKMLVEECYKCKACLLYTSPSPRDGLLSRMPSSA